MEIIEVASGLKKPIVIRLVEGIDFKKLTRKRYSFDWRSAKDSSVIYKLHIRDEHDILGVVGITDVPADKRIEIKLLASSVDNQGQNKRYEGIAGCLISFACSLAKTSYGDDGCVSLVPKTELIAHYMRKYYMLYGGRQLYLEGATLNKLIKEYYV